MPFPTTSELDNFTRANGGVGANWTGGPYGFGDPAPTILSNLCYNGGGAGYSDAVWNVTQPGNDAEVWLVVPTVGATDDVLGVYLGFQQIGASTIDGFAFYLKKLSGTDTLTLVRIGNQSETTLGSPVSQEFSAGDAFGLERIGTTIKGYYKAAAGAWTEIISVTDANFSGTGYIGFTIQGSTYRVSSFGGGNVVSASPEVEQSAYRHRNDDGSESGATFAADLNTPVTLARQSAIRTRIQLNATDDIAAMQFRQEYRRKRTGLPADPWKVLT